MRQHASAAKASPAYLDWPGNWEGNSTKCALVDHDVWLLPRCAVLVVAADANDFTGHCRGLVNVGCDEGRSRRVRVKPRGRLACTRRSRINESDATAETHQTPAVVSPAPIFRNCGGGGLSLVSPIPMLARTLARRVPQRAARRLACAPAVRHFNSVTEQDIAHFSKVLAPTSILSTLPPVSTPASELSNFNNDWMDKYHGQSTTVLRPKSTKEVSEIVKWCNERDIAIVPQGGNTGLVGGGVPVKDELILSLGNMNKIRSFDPVSGESHRSLHYPSLQRFASCRYYCGGCRLHP